MGTWKASHRTRSRWQVTLTRVWSPWPKSIPNLPTRMPLRVWPNRISGATQPDKHLDVIRQCPHASVAQTRGHNYERLRFSPRCIFTQQLQTNDMARAQCTNTGMRKALSRGCFAPLPRSEGKKSRRCINTNDAYPARGTLCSAMPHPYMAPCTQACLALTCCIFRPCKR